MSTIVRLNGVWYASHKCLWAKLQGNDQNFWIIPRINVGYTLAVGAKQATPELY